MKRTDLVPLTVAYSIYHLRNHVPGVVLDAEVWRPIRRSVDFRMETVGYERKDKRGHGMTTSSGIPVLAAWRHSENQVPALLAAAEATREQLLTRELPTVPSNMAIFLVQSRAIERTWDEQLKVNAADEERWAQHRAAQAAELKRQQEARDRLAGVLGDAMPSWYPNTWDALERLAQAYADNIKEGS